MSGFKYKGSTANLIISSQGSVKMDKYGDHTATCTFKVKPDQWASVPKKGDAHPYATWLMFVKRRVVFTPGYWTVTCDYKGSSYDGGSDNDVDPVYELNYGSGTEPIETHPGFKTDIGGTPATPKNGAIFVDGNGNLTTDDAVGVFDRFLNKNPDAPVGGGEAPSFAGVESYLDMNNVTWTKTWVTRADTVVDGGEVKIEVPEDEAPKYKCPDFDGRDWLYLGMSTTGSVGGSAKHRKIWRLSGAGGWNPEIYKVVPSSP